MKLRPSDPAETNKRQCNKEKRVYNVQNNRDNKMKWGAIEPASFGNKRVPRLHMIKWNFAHCKVTALDLEDFGSVDFEELHLRFDHGFTAEDRAVGWEKRSLLSLSM